jgi:glycosyltransferase involved in cell wall biosynthesis
MKIAHIIPHSISYPLSSHNGRYEWVAQLAKQQAEAGHEVTIYGNPISHIKGIVAAGIHTESHDKKQNNLQTFRLAFQNNHDVFHSHFDNLHYEVAGETTAPIIFTQHWPSTDATVELAISSNATNVWAVPPTQYMYNLDSELGIQSKGFIYHGIDLSFFKPTGIEKNKRLLFVSRIAPEKNLDIAISTAQKTGIGLDIIGKVAEKNLEYWHRLKPHVDNDQIRYLGPKTREELVGYYSAASALLFPSSTDEPFGLVAIESQACGTPVIMYRGGSRGELIKENETGFLCDTKDNFITAVENIHSLSPAECIHFAQKFNLHTMVSAYENLYRNLAP